MDSVTQFALGAAIGEVTLRHKNEAGKRTFHSWGAALLGGVVATIPDLDVLTTPYLTPPQALASHRGISHSLFFCTLLALAAAPLCERLFSARGISRKRWFIFLWTALNTHWMLDSLTTYGTQIFQPFSNYPVNIGSVFIIDPLYTLPLILGTAFSLWTSRGEGPLRPRAARAGLVISTLYLIFSLFSKYIVFHRLQAAWLEEGAPYQQMITVATPFNCLVYYAYVDTGDDVWVADGALLDPPERRPVWQRIPKNADLLPRFGEGAAGEVLLWFSRGFYRLELREGKPECVDLRFGRMRGWLTPQDPAGKDYIFRYALLPERSEGPYRSFKAPPPEGRFSDFPWRLLWRRMKGLSPN